MNTRWKNNIVRMKVKKRDSLKNKRQKILTELQKKDKIAQKILDKSKNLKENLNKERIEKGADAMEKIKMNVSKNFESIETKLMKEEERTNERGIFILHYLVLIFSEKNMNHLKKIKDTFSTKINKSMSNFQSHLKELHIRMDENDKMKTEKTFKKFENSVSQHHLL